MGPRVREDAEQVRRWADENQVKAFQSGQVKGDAKQAATLASIAVRVTGAGGFYRAPGGASTVFITFGPVTVTSSSGRSETFIVNVTE